MVSNPDIANIDEDDLGDASDPDIDGDDVANEPDNDPEVDNADQADDVSFVNAYLPSFAS